MGDNGTTVGTVHCTMLGTADHNTNTCCIHVSCMYCPGDASLYDDNVSEEINTATFTTTSNDDAALTSNARTHLATHDHVTRATLHHLPLRIDALTQVHVPNEQIQR